LLNELNFSSLLQVRSNKIHNFTKENESLIIDIFDAARKGVKFMNETVSNKNASSLICFTQCPSILFLKISPKYFGNCPDPFEPWIRIEHIEDCDWFSKNCDYLNMTMIYTRIC